MKNHKANFWGAVFLVTGVCIGGGMLALPVDTAEGGFFPSFVAMLASWAFMTLTALLLVEANLWLEEGSHIMTMASKLLGNFGKISALFLYLFMAYGSLVAYTTGGGKLIEVGFSAFFHMQLSHLVSCCIFVLLFGLILFLGAKILGRINAVLVIGMIGAYIALLMNGMQGLDIVLLVRNNWRETFQALPILLAIFSFQMIVPSLIPYLDRDPKKCTRAILIGTSIALVVYLAWQLVVLGSIPLNTKEGLLYAKSEGLPATESIRLGSQNILFSFFSDFFAFFAIATSYIGISLGLFDFLADALQVVKKGVTKIGLVACVLIPSTFFGILFPKAFVLSLQITGGFGDALLNGILPVLMVISGRYYLCKNSSYTVPGGKILLTVLFCFALIVISAQIKNIFSW